MPEEILITTLRECCNDILKNQGSYLRLTDFVRRKERAAQFKTATFTNVVVIFEITEVMNATILGIVQVIDIHKPFRWMIEGLPGPNTRKIYHHQDKEVSASGWPPYKAGKRQTTPQRSKRGG